MQTELMQYRSYRTVQGVSSGREWALRWTSPVVWTFGTLMAVVCGGGLAAMFSWSFGLLLAPAAGFLSVAFIDAILTTYRDKRAQLVLGYVENAVRLNLPLNYFLEAAGHGEGFMLRRRLRNLREYLSMGVPLSEALALGVPEISARSVALLAAAEANGNTTEVLGRLVQEDLGRFEESAAEQTIMHRGYSFAVIITLVNIIFFTMVYVMPKFRAIFYDFKTDLPKLTKFWLGVSDWTANQFGWVLMVIPFGIFLWVVARMLRRMIAPWWPTLVPGGVYVWIGRSVVDAIPMIGGMRRDEQLADVCRVLADGLRAGRSPEVILANARQGVTSPILLQRMEAWELLVLGGTDLADAAMRAGMPELFCGMLNTFGAGGTREKLAGLMDFLAAHYRMKFSRTMIVLRAAVEPLTTLFLALVVGSFVLALFLPLVKLIYSVAGVEEGWL